MFMRLNNMVLFPFFVSFPSFSILRYFLPFWVLNHSTHASFLSKNYGDQYPNLIVPIIEGPKIKWYLLDMNGISAMSLATSKLILMGTASPTLFCSSILCWIAWRRMSALKPGCTVDNTFQMNSLDTLAFGLNQVSGMYFLHLGSSLIYSNAHNAFSSENFLMLIALWSLHWSSFFSPSKTSM